MKKALCILLALLMAGCTVPAEQTEGAPQSDRGRCFGDH